MLPVTICHILGNEYATSKIMPESRKSWECMTTHDEFSMILQDFWTFEFTKLFNNNDSGLKNTEIGECLTSP